MTLLNPKTPIHPPYFLPTSFFLLQLLRLEKTSEIISSSHQAIPTMPIRHCLMCTLFLCLKTVIMF